MKEWWTREVDRRDEPMLRQMFIWLKIRVVALTYQLDRTPIDLILLLDYPTLLILY